MCAFATSNNKMMCKAATFVSPNKASMRSMQLRKMALLFQALFSRRMTWFLRARCFRAANSCTRSDASFAIATCGMQAWKSASSQMKATYVKYLRVHEWGTLARGCTLPHFVFVCLITLPQAENIQWQMLVSSTLTRRMRFSSGHCCSAKLYHFQTASACGLLFLRGEMHAASAKAGQGRSISARDRALTDATTLG